MREMQRNIKEARTADVKINVSINIDRKGWKSSVEA